MSVSGRTLMFALALLAGGGAALADKVKNPVAVFSGLDKITGRIIAFEVTIDETVQFGSLQLTPRVCYSRPNYENPQTDVFVEVDEIALNNETKRLFAGWMFAASPGLNAVEHPVYDLWLTDCKGGSEIIKTAPEEEEEREVVPLETKRTAKPAQPVERKASTKAKQPAQSFFPTNAPPPQNIDPARRAGTPMVIMPANDPTNRSN